MTTSMRASQADTLTVCIVEGKGLFQRKQMLGAVTPGERFSHRLYSGVTGSPKARQHLGVDGRRRSPG